MTSPDDTTMGEVERVPLKVVPIFVTPIEPEPESEPPEDADDLVVDEPEPRRPTLALLTTSVLLALATVGVHISAIVIATAGDYPTGTVLGYVAIGLSVLAVTVGVIAAVVGRGRLWAILAASVAVLANPFLLLVVLRFLSGFQTG
ncbi:MAG: hypothetical protein KF761_07510 [Salinibacterium sp.]|nr:hypothetical protein [Salinibacterium sp.]